MAGVNDNTVYHSDNKGEEAMPNQVWTHEQLLELCDVANGLTPDEMRRQIVWFALMSEREEQG